MKTLPTVLCSSVVRSAVHGESHGGIYLVDLAKEQFVQVVDWNDEAIDWEGRGGDRGLRGLAFSNDMILAAASDEIFFYNQDFKLIKSIKNKYLKHCHEIYVERDILYISSTGYDSIIEYNLKSEEFKAGHCYRKIPFFNTSFYKKISRYFPSIAGRLNLGHYFLFDPNGNDGPKLTDSFHINNVFVQDGNVFFSGTGMQTLNVIDKQRRVSKLYTVPKGTHNVRIYDNSLIYNHTPNNTITIRDITTGDIHNHVIGRYQESELLYADIPKDFARQSFGRGLCMWNGFLIGGSSPCTISIYDKTKNEAIRSINITKDVRNAIHGLEVYPYRVSI